MRIVEQQQFSQLNSQVKEEQLVSRPLRLLVDKVLMEKILLVLMVDELNI